MCKICLQTPCPPQCPNYEPQIAHHCAYCDQEIYVGDTYYEIEGKAICEECIDYARKEAE